jgi:predicted phosphodiesterase
MDEKQSIYEIILVGDSGNINRNKPDDIMELLKNHLSNSKDSGVIFLGDNVYPQGLPALNHPLRKDAEKVLDLHRESLKDYKGKIVFISGNHDWNKGKSDGLAYVIRQEKYIKELFDNNCYFVPENGEPGPTEININDQICIVAINTQWWLQRNKRVSKEWMDKETFFYKKITEILNKNKEKRIIVLGHHPIYSYSLHGGKYKLRHHLFPLTIYKRKAFIPMPFFGSLLPLYRKYVGAKEDIAYRSFKELRKKLKAIFRQHPGLIYACGHEHNLQYIEKYHINYIVSGAASKATYVIDGKYSKFGLSGKGFFKLKFFNNKKIKIEALITNKNNALGTLVYESWIT